MRRILYYICAAVAGAPPHCAVIENAMAPTSDATVASLVTMTDMPSPAFTATVSVVLIGELCTPANAGPVTVTDVKRDVGLLFTRTSAENVIDVAGATNVACSMPTTNNAFDNIRAVGV